MINRREFIVQLGLGSAALVAGLAMAEGAMVAESDAQAVALGYKADGSKTDKAKYPKYAAGQQCSGCAMYQGKPGDADGGCVFFPGKQVTAKGWCSAWTKKA